MWRAVAFYTAQDWAEVGAAKVATQRLPARLALNKISGVSKERVFYARCLRGAGIDQEGHKSLKIEKK